VANVTRLSYCIETRVSASPSCLQQALQHALIARKMRESKNLKLAVIARRKNLLLYLEHFGPHFRTHDLVITSKQEIARYQTLVDWFVASGGIHFEPDSENENGERGGEG